MNQKKRFASARCIITDAVYLLLALGVFPRVQNYVSSQPEMLYKFTPVFVVNILCWVILAVLVLFRAHSGDFLYLNAVVQCVLIGISVCLIAVAFWFGISIKGALLLLVEQVYGLVVFFRTRKKVQ